MQDKPPRVVVIGSVNADLVMNVEALPKPGETVTGGTFHVAHGGKGANQAVAAARAAGEAGGGAGAATVAFVARVGDDDHGRAMREAFDADGIDTSHVTVDDTEPTGTALITVDAHGENCIAVAAGANGTLDASYIDAAGESIGGASHVLLQMETPTATVAAAIDAAAGAGAMVMVNYAPVGDAAVPLSDRIGLLIVNETEAAMLAGDGSSAGGADAALDVAEALRERGPRGVVITLGGAGVVAVDADGGRHHVAAFEVEPVDTTGAGDTFCGALAAALAEGRAFDGALRFAAAAGALATTAAGAQPSIPTRDRIEALLRSAG